MFHENATGQVSNFAPISNGEICHHKEEFSIENALTSNEYEQLLRQKKEIQENLAEIEAKLELVKVNQLEKLIEQIQSCISKNNLSPEQIFPHLTFRKVRVFRDKYRNPETGETWNGRGDTPEWLKGKFLELFAIPKDEQKE